MMPRYVKVVMLLDANMYGKMHISDANDVIVKAVIDKFGKDNVIELHVREQETFDVPARKGLRDCSSGTIGYSVIESSPYHLREEQVEKPLK